MKTHVANDKLTNLIEFVEKKGVDVKSIIKSLKELREAALAEQDPLVTKVLRLSYEYLEENKSFDVEAQYEEDEEGNEYPVEMESKDNLLYLLNLLVKADHKINREEIKDYRTALKADLY
tara:strand:- start:140 stop:499 length:360 start_codon:yes stop_codon:yes gene_type:complete